MARFLVFMKQTREQNTQFPKAAKPGCGIEPDVLGHSNPGKKEKGETS